ncbi:MAG: SDR family oxidoreductase [Nitrospirota bacterium]|nr:MAG: SDR family oxidoreductase [Nitrospirota bacterium]
MKNTLLITGGAGYLGQHLISHAGSWRTHATYFQTPPPEGLQTTWHHCDLRDGGRVKELITSLHPDVIIHTACSNRSLEEIEAIVPAARNLAQGAKESPCRLIHLSSDLVFDGEDAPYDEKSRPKPINDYGQAKAEAEHSVAALFPKAAIVRTSLMYGMDPVDHQSRWLLDGLNKGQTIQLFTDEIRCPIWIHTLTECLLELTRMDFSGMLNIAGPDPLTRWEFGLGILALHNRTPTERIVPSTRAEAGLIRPRDLTLNIEKVKHILNIPLLSLREVHQRHYSRDSTSVKPTVESTS